MNVAPDVLRAETDALRLLRDGYSPDQIRDRTGVNRERLVQLAQTFGGNRPVPRPGTRPIQAVPIAAAKLAPATEMLRAGDLFVDDSYQRDLDLRRVLRMAGNYDPALLGVLEVSDRGDGRYAIVDGAHRWELVRHVDTAKDDARVLCRVHRNLTVEKEAELFYAIDLGRRKLTGWDRWKARLRAGDEDAIDIQMAVERLGLKLAHQRAPGVISSHQGCEDVVRLGGIELLEQTLRVLTSAWQRTQGLDFEIVGGTALVLHHYERAEIQTHRLVEALASVLPRQLKARARAQRELHSGSLPRLTAIVIVQIVNDQRGPHRAVPPFASRWDARSDSSHRREAAKTAVDAQRFTPLLERGLNALQIAEGEGITRKRVLHALVPVLHDKGLSDGEIATQLGCTDRQVQRIRHPEQAAP